ncbi:aldehyde dehydrogenase family protein, partial [Bacillus cereus]|uniref:aldehyde dehydrogenase family protein n=1 Tax=Bacillus cereus TaxID=1396 RepID=UPI00284DEB72
MSVEIPSSLQAFVRGLNPEEGVWIAGKARAASDGKTFPVYDPATTEVIASVSSGTRQDASAAVDAAVAAFEGWADTSPRERAEILRKAFTLMLEQAEPLAGLMAWE